MVMALRAISWLLFSWVEPLMRLGARRPLQQADLLDLPCGHSMDHLAKQVIVTWEAEGRQKKSPSLLHALRRAYLWEALWPALPCKLVYDVVLFVMPALLKSLIETLEAGDQGEHGAVADRVALVAALVGASFLNTLLLQQYFHAVFSLSLRAKAGLQMLVYEKGLRLQAAALHEADGNANGVDRAIAIFSIDIDKCGDLAVKLHQAWSAPLQIALTITLLLSFLGPASLVAIPLLMGMVPMNWLIAGAVGRAAAARLEATDVRVATSSQLLDGQAVIKAFCWSQHFVERIRAQRAVEQRRLRHCVLLSTLSICLWSFVPVLTSFVVFATYAALNDGNVPPPSVLFTSIALLANLAFPITNLPELINAFAETQVSALRVQRFLQLPEVSSRAPPLADDVDKLAVRRPCADVVASPIPPGGLPIEPPSPPEYAPNVPAPVDARSALITFAGGDHAWRAGERPVLFDLHATIWEGELTAVVGGVGAGKSSLCAAFLSELVPTAGAPIERAGLDGQHVAYAAQTPWIFNASVRANILFGASEDRMRLDRVLRACALVRDLQALPHGLETEIGTHGVNLSGGQKWRVSLARAAYSAARIVVLDDPLSALDADVGKAVLEECICGVLRGRTVLLVTNHFHACDAAHSVLVLRGGTIVEQGRPADLAADATSEFVRLRALRPTADTAALDSTEDEPACCQSSDLAPRFVPPTPQAVTVELHGVAALADVTDVSAPDGQNGSGAELASLAGASASASSESREYTQREDRHVGSVSLRTYERYCRAIGWRWGQGDRGKSRACGLALCAYLSLLALIVGAQSARVSTDYWLVVWREDQLRQPALVYLGGYAGLSALTGVLLLAANVLLALTLLRAASSLHDAVLEVLPRAPMAFFWRNPSGRILNRLSKDQSTLDEALLEAVVECVGCVSTVCGALVLALVTVPVFAAALLPLAAVYGRVRKYYNASSRELKRLDSISRSPLLSHYFETLSGLQTIRSYRAMDMYMATNRMLLEANQRAVFCMLSSNRWLAIRLEAIGALMLGTIATFAAAEGRRAALYGLALSYIVSTAQDLNWVVRSSALVETLMTSAERLLAYTELPQEAADPREAPELPPGWPHAGAVDLVDIELRYAVDAPLVLRGVSLQIPPASRVGMVGRTGSGKSSLFNAILRLVEPTSGHVLLDGVDCSVVGLQQLRSVVAYIPQDPLLLSGTLRFNLDPQARAADDTICDAIGQVQLGSLLKEVDGGLAFMVAPGGKNVSQGQRQLLCLARALLLEPKLMLLDEATSSVDPHTDGLLQSSVLHRSGPFTKTTQLTVAHRLSTVADADLIVVMGDGRIVEHGKPTELLSQPSSAYSLLVEASHK